VVVNVPQKYGNVKTNRFHGCKLDGTDKAGFFFSFGTLKSFEQQPMGF
jgi:hypothetical protein